jgi:CBS domain-containing protein
MRFERGKHMPFVTRPLRLKRVHSPSGISKSAPTVKCPLTNQVAPVSSCRECSQRQTLSIGTSAPSSVSCSVDDQIASGAPVSPVDLQTLLHETTAADVMSQDVSCVSGDLPLAALSEIFDDRDISCAPVIDEAGRLEGLVTKSDLVGELFDFDHEPAVEVAELMVLQPTTVSETTTLDEVMPLLQRSRHLAVLAADGELVGVISAHDIVRWLGARCL